MAALLDRAVILAGGEGRRLWPWTAPERPKPLLPLGGAGRSLLGATVDRLGAVTEPGTLFLQAEARLGQRLLDGETRLGSDQLLSEPSPRDTAPAVTLTMLRAARWRADAVVGLFPADHRIADPARMQLALDEAAHAARRGALVVFGVAPTRAATEFGYVELEAALASGANRVARFTEKPAPDLAYRFLQSGRHLWNAGIFVWRADRFIAELERVAPDLLAAVTAYLDGDYAAWERAERGSIDRLLMERATGVEAIPLEAGWDDVGGWEAVARLAQSGDAGPARLRPLRGPGAADSVAITLGEEQGSVLLCEPGPWLLVQTQDGTLLARRDQPVDPKPWL